jgi:hypothetical protein
MDLVFQCFITLFIANVQVGMRKDSRHSPVLQAVLTHCCSGHNYIYISIYQSKLCQKRNALAQNVNNAPCNNDAVCFSVSSDVINSKLPNKVIFMGRESFSPAMNHPESA